MVRSIIITGRRLPGTTWAATFARQRRRDMIRSSKPRPFKALAMVWKSRSNYRGALETENPTVPSKSAAPSCKARRARCLEWKGLPPVLFVSQHVRADRRAPLAGSRRVRLVRRGGDSVPKISGARGTPSAGAKCAFVPVAFQHSTFADRATPRASMRVRSLACAQKRTAAVRVEQRRQNSIRYNMRANEPRAEDQMTSQHLGGATSARLICFHPVQIATPNTSPATGPTLASAANSQANDLPMMHLASAQNANGKLG
jgi:hypothetical protein